MRKTIAPYFAFGATALMLAPVAAFAGIGEELSLAQTHALLAYRTGGRGERGIATARMHIHIVINCMVGPGGDGYDLTAPDLGPGRGGAPAAPPNMAPCAADKTSKGALKDAAGAEQKQKVMAVIALAKADLDITDNDKLTEAATALADALGEAKDAK